jgi:nitrogen fixation-related uncharacterized protein
MRHFLSLMIILTTPTMLYAERNKHYSDIDEPYHSMLEDSIALQDKQNNEIKTLIHEIRLLRRALESKQDHQATLMLKQNQLLEHMVNALESNAHPNAETKKIR